MNNTYLFSYLVCSALNDLVKIGICDRCKLSSPKYSPATQSQCDPLLPLCMVVLEPFQRRRDFSTGIEASNCVSSPKSRLKTAKVWLNKAKRWQKRLLVFLYLYLHSFFHAAHRMHVSDYLPFFNGCGKPQFYTHSRVKYQACHLSSAMQSVLKTNNSTTLPISAVLNLSL